MAMRLSGLMSGMDTESVIQQLVEARSAKVTKAKNEQTKLEWKQETWKGLNTKLKALQSKLNSLRFTGDYLKKTTKVSDSSIASVLTSGDAVNSVQELQVVKMAKTAYLTGGKVSLKRGVTGGEVNALTQMQFLMDFSDGKSKTITLNKSDGSKVDIALTEETTISDVLTRFKEEGLNASFDANQKRFFVSAKEAGEEGNFMITGDWSGLRALGLSASNHSDYAIKTTDGGAVTAQNTMASIIEGFGEDDYAALTFQRKDGTEFDISLSSNTTIEDVVRQLQEGGMHMLKDIGVNATFDEHQQQLFMQDIAGIRVKRADGVEPNDVLKGLGFQIAYTNGAQEDGFSRVGSQTLVAAFSRGQDAAIRLNGAEFTSTNNVFEINGLTITAQATTEAGKSVTLTTSQDTDGIYDMIKDFFKAYNEVINEIDKLYNADEAKNYEPLTDDEKKSMSESEVEKYEQKIKDSLLRKDSTLGTLGNAMKKVMLSGFYVDGKLDENDKTMYLANFGIETLNYFLASDSERNSYHINGDSDDTNVSANEDKLKKMITADPDAVVSFFTQLTQKLYTEMDKQSKPIEGYRSFGSFYDDKKMKSDYDDYKTKIKDLEKKLADYEDKWYAKFAAMETAMAKMQRSASAVTGLLGGS